MTRSKQPVARASRGQRAARGKTAPAPAPPARKSFGIVGIGASAGGLEAFAQLLQALPEDTGLAYVLVQHLSPGHASMLAELLGRKTSIPVREVRAAVALEPNQIYVMPADQYLVLAGDSLKLVPRADPGRPIDQFFVSLADQAQHRAIGVVLSGTASDGTEGLKHIKGAGGITFAQDQTALHDGMPRSAIASGCVDFVLAPAAIAQELARIGQHAHVVVPDGDLVAEAESADGSRALARVLK